jgi:adenosine deaminase
VRHAEIFFDPQTHTDRGIGFDVVIEGLLSGMQEAKEKLGITSKLIMCFLRHLPQTAAFETLAMAQPWLDQIAGVGLDSSEQGHPPSKFAGVFAAAAAKGLRLVAHAGEEGPPAYVWEALDDLHIHRIDHGNRALEDERLIKRIVADGLTLTVCPLSNHKLCVVDDLKNHPLKRMLDLGLKATVNSDDPAYFGGYVNANFVAVAKALSLSRADVLTLARNSFSGSFLPADAVARHLAEIEAYAA